MNPSYASSRCKNQCGNKYRVGHQSPQLTAAGRGAAKYDLTSAKLVQTQYTSAAQAVWVRKVFGGQTKKKEKDFYIKCSKKEDMTWQMVLRVHGKINWREAGMHPQHTRLFSKGIQDEGG